jgi:mRNA-degrading endonuclease toxin of MazEF toxin-antitoxin module
MKTNYIKLAGIVRNELLQMVAAFSAMPNRPSAFEEALARFDIVQSPAGKGRKAHKAAVAESASILRDLSSAVLNLETELARTSWAASLPKPNALLQRAVECAQAVGADCTSLKTQLYQNYLRENKLGPVRDIAKQLMDAAPDVLQQTKWQARYGDALRVIGDFDAAGEQLQEAMSKLHTLIPNDAQETIAEVKNLQERIQQRRYQVERTEEAIPTQGEIYWASGAGSGDPCESRPVIVLSFRKYNERMKSALVVPLRGNCTDSPFELNLLAGDGGLKQRSQAFCSGFTRIQLSCFKERIGKLPRYLVHQIALKVRRIFDIQ